MVLASSGQAVALHVTGHDAERIGRIARFVQSREWGGVLFTAAPRAGRPARRCRRHVLAGADPRGERERAPDLLVTFPWTSEPNAFGVPGTDLACVSGGARLFASDHGGMSPWNVRNTLLAWGPDFKKGVTVATPVGNVDVAPTILAALGIDDRDGMDGRVLIEALARRTRRRAGGGRDAHRHRGRRRVSRRAADLDDRRPPLCGQELAHPLSGWESRRTQPFTSRPRAKRPVKTAWGFS